MLESSNSPTDSSALLVVMNENSPPSPNNKMANRKNTNRCKRKTTSLANGQKPTTVSRRNARERNRVKQVNNGFATLRDHVPSGRNNKKLSKVDTLKSAVEYIKHLHTVLDSNSSSSFDSESDSSPEYQFSESCGSPASDSLPAGSPANSCDYSAPESNTPSPVSYIDLNASIVHAQYNTTTTCHQNKPDYITLSTLCPSSSVAGSPTPSYVSDASSYDNICPNGQDLMDFSVWFS